MNISFLSRTVIALCFIVILGCNEREELEIEPLESGDSALAEKIEFCNRLKESRISSNIRKFVTQLVHKEFLERGERAKACEDIEKQKKETQEDLGSYLNPQQSEFRCRYTRRDSSGTVSTSILTKDSLQKEYDDLMDWFESLEKSTPC